MSRVFDFIKDNFQLEDEEIKFIEQNLELLISLTVENRTSVNFICNNFGIRKLRNEFIALVDNVYGFNRNLPYSRWYEGDNIETLENYLRETYGFDDEALNDTMYQLVGSNHHMDERDQLERLDDHVFGCGIFELEPGTVYQYHDRGLDGILSQLGWRERFEFGKNIQNYYLFQGYDVRGEDAAILIDRPAKFICQVEHDGDYEADMGKLRYVEGSDVTALYRNPNTGKLYIKVYDND